jgi:hypothetical protein
VKIRIDPYKPGSKSAKALAVRTGILRVTPAQIRKHGTFDLVLNWGNSQRRTANERYINDPEAVALASDKVGSCGAFSGAGVTQPAFTCDKDEAESWFADGASVLCRTLTRASGGRGIVLATHGTHNSSEPEGGHVGADRRIDSDESETLGGDGAADTGSTGRRDTADAVGGAAAGGDRGGDAGTGGTGRTGRVVDAPLYTKYVKKADEYRIHVFDGQVIDIQQKRKRQEVPNEEVDYQIRNLAGGWVFCRDDVVCPSVCSELAISAVATLGLTFGAVDIGYNRNEQRGYVYEVNTAPGLEGSTLDNYFEALVRYIPEIGRGAFARRRAA